MTAHSESLDAKLMALRLQPWHGRCARGRVTMVRVCAPRFLNLSTGTALSAFQELVGAYLERD